MYIKHADEDKTKKLKKYEQKMQDLWDAVKRPNLRIVDLEEREGYKLRA
jgi:hypothetical protein